MKDHNRLNTEELQKLIGVATRKRNGCLKIVHAADRYSHEAANDARKALCKWGEIRRKLMDMCQAELERDDLDVMQGHS